jgi:hypothetical protein
MYPPVCITKGGQRFTQEGSTPSTPPPPGKTPQLLEESVPADWKTYTNPDYGLSFNYPNSFIIDTNYGSSGFPDFHYLALIKDPKITDRPEPGLIAISVWNNPQKLSVFDFEKAHQENKGWMLYDPLAQSKPIGNKVGFYSSEGKCEPVVCHIYTVGTDSKIFVISTYYDVTSNNDKTIDQILSTFKFMP